MFRLCRSFFADYSYEQFSLDSKYQFGRFLRRHLLSWARFQISLPRFLIATKTRLRPVERPLFFQWSLQIGKEFFVLDLIGHLLAGPVHTGSSGRLLL